MSIKFNKHGLRVNNITSDNITSSDGFKFLNEKESDLKYISNETVQNYNWTPDWRNTVRGIDVASFEIPVNGWLSINKGSSPIFINGNKITTLTNDGSYQSMSRAGDVITSEAEFTYTFAPCKSEILDWREVPTDYDIWRGAIFRNDDGSVESYDLYIPDATNWKTNVYDANELTITKIENNKAYNGEEFVCNIQSEKIKKGNHMFYECTNLTSFSSDLSSLTDGYMMFYGCKNLTTFTSDLSSLTDGYMMFHGCKNLTTFSFDLPNLTNGKNMFGYCSSLTSFTSDLSSLTNGEDMFRLCNNLTTFVCDDLSSLTSGYHMFYYCKNLTTFSSDLSNLTNGKNMFGYCSSLTSFTSDLSSLTNGDDMFSGANLSVDSFRNIASTINDISEVSGTHDIHLGSIPLLDFEDYNMYLEEITSKGWNIECKMVGPSFFDAKKVINNTFYDLNDEVIGTFDTSSILYGSNLFEYKKNLTTFDSDLGSLIKGNYMFCGCTNLASFTVDLSNITDGTWTFYKCTSLTSFSSDLSNLTDGYEMFYNCTKLESFSSDLPSLTDGYNMFSSCKLDAPSVERILTSIPTNTSNSRLTLGIQSSAASKFAEITGTTPTTTEQTVSYKGWSVKVKINS